MQKDKLYAYKMEQQYIDIYDQHHEIIKKNSSNLMNTFRDEAFEQFKKLGFPTNALEKYKYTDLRNSLAIDYGLNINRIKFIINPYNIFKCDVPGIAAYLYFIVNDMFYPVKSGDENRLPAGVIIDSIKSASTKYPELIEKYYNKLASKQDDGLVAFNGTFAQDGFFIYIPKNVHLEKPIQIVDILTSGTNLMANSRNLIVMEENAKCQLLVCDHTEDNTSFLANRVTEVFVGENAFYEHYKLENVHNKATNTTHLLVDQQASSNVLTNIITLHNGITRNTIQIDLNGENCETLLCGMALGDKNQQVDNHSSICHNKPHSHSTELFKYVMDDFSRAGFTGMLYVAKDAQKTQAFQTNRNILLSKDAKVKTRPQLEIYADDVKCSHGATIGQLDESAMFYMRQRGLPEKEARLLLMYAFTADIIENIRIEALKDRIKYLVEKRLRGELSKCEGCAICK
ncbi:MAG: Fe-S cluster assembly protein SufD [Paludibacteraceae bacterium]